MELFIIIERNVGYYDDPDSFTIRGILTSPGKILELDFPSRLDTTDLTILTVKQEDLDKNIYADISSYYASSDDLKSQSYKEFLKEHNIDLKKTMNKLK